MEKVIQDLNNYVEKLQKNAETQKKLDESIEELIRIKENVKSIENTVDTYTKTLKEIENKHDTISNQFASVLQDYKKLHSAFELLDIELKKINAKNENFENLLLDFKATQQEVSEKTINEINKTKVQNQVGFDKTQTLIQDIYEQINTKLIELEIKNNTLLEILQDSKVEILELQNKNMKKNKIWFSVLTGIAGLILVLTIVGLFI